MLVVRNFNPLALDPGHIYLPYDKHHKMSSLVKSHQNTILSNMNQYANDK